MLLAGSYAHSCSYNEQALDQCIYAAVQTHMIAVQPGQLGSLCPVISAVDFPKHTAEDDLTCMCNIT